MGSVVSTLAFPVPDRTFSAHRVKTHQDLHWLTTKDNFKIPCFYIKHDQAKYTVIYSHGNAEDIGISAEFFDTLVYRTKVNLLAYEYGGYSISYVEEKSSRLSFSSFESESAGKPNEQTCYYSIQAAYDFLVNEHNVPKENIILFGRSLGSGPTVDLASKEKNIAGVILQSPLESGIRSQMGSAARPLGFMDIFRNIDKIEKVEAPTMIIHGTADRVVPCSNGKSLYKRLKKPVEPHWLSGFGHNDIPDDIVFKAVVEFLKKIDQKTTTQETSQQKQ
eukprot:c64_g1_i1.p1 GENE.c64_g1_i1~~c64_g1_i1.p1  ORF type:complete len:284 (+),score=104.12 c64_g1_i1:24-854(+)